MIIKEIDSIERRYDSSAKTNYFAKIIYSKPLLEYLEIIVLPFCSRVSYNIKIGVKE